MAWTTPKTWTAGDTLTAADMNTYVSDNDADLDLRTVKTFADSSARTSGIPSPTEGMMSYLADTDAVEVYDGSAWTSVGSTPTLLGYDKVEYSATVVASVASNTWYSISGLALTYTPVATGSLIVITCHLAQANVINGTGAAGFRAAIYDGSTRLSIPAASGSRTLATAGATWYVPSSFFNHGGMFQAFDTSTGSAKTYTAQVHNWVPTTQNYVINRQYDSTDDYGRMVGSSSLMVMEFAV